MRRGFSLLEMSIALLVSALLATTYLKFTRADITQATGDCRSITKAQMHTIREAINRFARSNDRLPMPARRWVGVESATYGYEAPATDLDVVGTATYGALPIQALAIPLSNAGDCWGNKYTYAVTTALTTKTSYLNTPKGSIVLKTNASLTADSKIAYAVISHGPDQLGAVKINYDDSSKSTPDRKWCTGAGTTMAYTNCLGDASAAVIMNATYNDGKDANANYFDDIVIAEGKPIGTPANCTLPWGGTIAHAASVTAYQAPSTTPCVSETRTCDNGTLSGTYQHQSCAPGLGCPASSAILTWNDQNYVPKCIPDKKKGFYCLDTVSMYTTGCSAAGYPALADGEVKTLNNETPGIFGSINVGCNNGVVTLSSRYCSLDGSSNPF